MKRLVKILPILVVLTSLVGCSPKEPDPTPVHEHTFSEQYAFDREFHWHNATCEHTNLVSDIARHSFNDNGECVCGYKLPHEHTFSTTYSFNEVNHWYKATCEHTDEISGLEQHNFVDGVCKCGYKEPAKETKLVFKAESTALEIMDSFITDEIKTEYGFIVNLAYGLAESYEDRCIGEGDIVYKRYNFNYPSTSYDGKDIILSGCVTIPFLNNEPVINNVVISSHPTFTDLSEAPSNGFDIYTIPVLVGAAVIEFDLLGYGITSSEPVDYHCRHLSSRNTVDGVIYAYDLIEEEFGIYCGGLDVYNGGYSQGGYDSLALLRYMEQEATGNEKSIIKIRQTHSGSGAYNLFIMLEESLKNDNFEYSEYIIMAIVSAFTFHNEALNGYTYEDILTPKGMELLEILEHKNDEELQAFKQKTIEGSDEKYIKGPKDVFKAELFDSNSAIYNAVKEAAELENILDGKWTPSGEVYIYYSVGDEMVAPACSLKAEEMWKELPNVSFDKIGFLVGSDHRSAAIEYYIYLLAAIYDNYPEA